MGEPTRTWKCSLPTCGREFKRHPSQVRNPATACCSVACATELRRTTHRGRRNGNYRHGRHAEPSTCDCGRIKDYRAALCATCAGRGYPAAGQVRPMPSGLEIAEAVAKAPDLATAASALGVSRQTLTRLAVSSGMDLNHMRPGRGRPTGADAFVLGEKRSRVIRSVLLRLEPEGYQCVGCGLGPEWRGAPLTLQLDHVNGNPCDNRRENLRWLCPNCHSQTDTYVGKNNKGRKGPRKAR